MRTQRIGRAALLCAICGLLLGLFEIYAWVDRSGGSLGLKGLLIVSALGSVIIALDFLVMPRHGDTWDEER